MKEKFFINCIQYEFKKNKAVFDVYLAREKDLVDFQNEKLKPNTSRYANTWSPILIKITYHLSYGCIIAYEVINWETEKLKNIFPIIGNSVFNNLFNILNDEKRNKQYFNFLFKYLIGTEIVY